MSDQKTQYLEEQIRLEKAKKATLVESQNYDKAIIQDKEREQQEIDEDIKSFLPRYKNMHMPAEKFSSVLLNDKDLVLFLMFGLPFADKSTILKKFETIKANTSVVDTGYYTVYEIHDWHYHLQC